MLFLQIPLLRKLADLHMDAFQLLLKEPLLLQLQLHLFVLQYVLQLYALFQFHELLFQNWEKEKNLQT